MIRDHLNSVFLSLTYISPVVDQIRVNLDAESAKWFRGVWISGIVVAAGCLLEVWEIVRDLRNWGRARKKQEPLKDDPVSWMYPMAALGLFLVVGGIVSETIFEVLDANVESRYRAHESDKITEAENNAASATEKAGTAADSAERTKKAAKVLEEDDKKIELNLLLKGSRAELLVDPKVRTKLRDAMKPLAGHKVDIRYPSDQSEGEPHAAAWMLYSIMQSAGVTVAGPMKEKAGPISGVVVYVTMKASEETKKKALILANALLDAPLVLRRNRTIPNPPPYGAAWDLSREPQEFVAGNEPPPFDDQTIVVLVAMHP